MQSTDVCDSHKQMKNTNVVYLISYECLLPFLSVKADHSG